MCITFQIRFLGSEEDEEESEAEDEDETGLTPEEQHAFDRYKAKGM